ncbi:MAG TPA: NAD-dependent epimerase/dehydratase family protein [Candidatus Binatia bacterium]|nr:NAD-dependent epimerase/dehydratase family protein [Candidatus Binatia bacterium]
MNAIITGAAGFVASHVVDALLARGERVYAIDSFVTGSPSNLEAASRHANFSLLTADVSQDSEKILGWLHEQGTGFDVILHMASPASPRDYKRLPVETLAVNGYGTDFCCRLAALFSARLLYTSTSEVYGDPLEHPQRETYWGNVNPIGSRSCYDEGKRFGEAMIMAHVRAIGIDARIVRIFNTYGPRMRIGDGRVVPNFISQALANRPLTIYGDGSQTRSFCYVDDMVRGILLAANGDDARGRVINLGNPSEISIAAFAKAVADSARVSYTIEACEPTEDDPTRRCPDISLAQSLLGWNPEIDLPEGLRRTITSFKSSAVREGEGSVRS